MLICLLAASAMAASAPAGRAADPEIRLLPAARVSAEQVRLSDVATVSGLEESVAGLVVLTLGEGGAVAGLSLDQVQTALRQAGVNPVPIAFGGAASCAVKRAAEPARPSQPVAQAPTEAVPVEPDAVKAPEQAAGRTIRQAILAQLADELGVLPAEIVLTFIPQAEADAGSAAGGLVGITSGDRSRLGRRRWRVDYTKGGQKFQRYLIGEVKLRRPAVVAARLLTAGQAITAEDVKLEVRDAAAEDGRMTDPASVVGQQARRPIAANQTISACDLAAPVLVKRGQTAQVTCGPVRLQARALGQGGPGDAVEFENPKSGGKFWAVMIGPALAEVKLALATGR
jgi:flagella basal body P-ring formation protein FlgA